MRAAIIPDYVDFASYENADDADYMCYRNSGDISCRIQSPLRKVVL